MAYQDDKYHRHAQVDAWEHLLGYAVLDQKGDKIGTVKALWEDYTRRPAYLGVATSWLDLGRIHLVPAQFATLSERQKCLRLSFPAEVVKGAPECHANDEITLSGETKIRDYYERKGVGSGRSYGEVKDTPLREDRAVRSPDWTIHDRREELIDRRDEAIDSRTFKDKIRDAVDEGKAKLSGKTEPAESYDRAEREMGLPFDSERQPLRKIYQETPVAEPVRPHDEDRPRETSRLREEDDFIPLRREASRTERDVREDNGDDLPLR